MQVFAKALQTETTATLVHIAPRTEFSDQSHFTNRVSEVVGVYPRAFRARHHKSESEGPERCSPIYEVYR
jgi:AraC-like DNA-binding protein